MLCTSILHGICYTLLDTGAAHDQIPCKSRTRWHLRQTMWTTNSRHTFGCYTGTLLKRPTHDIVDSVGSARWHIQQDPATNTRTPRSLHVPRRDTPTNYSSHPSCRQVGILSKRQVLLEGKAIARKANNHTSRRCGPQIQYTRLGL